MYKYKRNGFTLVELMAVIIIISLIALLTFPNIINQIKKTKKSNNKMIEDVVIEQAKKYVNDNEEEFQDDDGYCLSIDTLVDKGYVNEQLVDINNKDNDVIMMIKKGDFSYKIVNKNDCDVSEYQNIFVDNEGKKYTRVEYLESTGTQYIDTGLKSTVNTQILTKLSWNNVTKRQIFGSNNGMFFGVVNGYWQLGQTGNAGSSMEAAVGIWYNVDYKLTYNDTNYTNTLVVNNNTVTYNRDFIGDRKIYLFTIGNETNVATEFLSNCKLGNTKIKQNGNIVRDYIPVIDSSKRPCLFDKVEKKCYYNHGTGEFNYPVEYDLYDDSGNGYYKVKYLESTGTQYIDTGLKSAVNMQILTKLSWNNVTKRQIFGSNNGMFFGVVNGYWQLGQTGNAGSSMEAAVGIWYNVDYKLTYNNTNYTNTLVVNNNTVTYDRDFTGDRKIYLFTIGNETNVTTEYLSNCKLGNTIIKKNENIVRDYIPVIDSSKRPCLFDKVDKKCYYNQGSGEFLYG